MFCEREKKSKCPKKNFQSVGKGKNVSVKFRVFGKRKGIGRRVQEKNQSVLGKKKKKIFLSSYSLVGLYVNL